MDETAAHRYIRLVRERQEAEERRRMKLLAEAEAKRQEELKRENAARDLFDALLECVQRQARDFETIPVVAHARVTNEYRLNSAVWYVRLQVTTRDGQNSYELDYRRVPPAQTVAGTVARLTQAKSPVSPPLHFTTPIPEIPEIIKGHAFQLVELMVEDATR